MNTQSRPSQTGGAAGRLAGAQGVLASFGLAGLMASLLLSGCNGASESKHEATLQLDGFAEYVARFEAEAASRGRAVAVSDLAIRFGQVDASGESGGRGVCERAEGETPVITISRAAWESSTEEEREELVFHELGHCVLGKAHEPGVSGLGIPRSLMNPYRIDGSIYQQNKEYYLSDLFSK